MFKSVDLPEPLLPMIAISSPLRTARSSPCNDTTSRSATLKIFTRLSQTMYGAAPFAV